MTLGGLALAVGILVDDATVTIENIERNFEQGKDSAHAAFWTARRRSRCRRWFPRCASASCFCRCSFSPAWRGYLFIPLAEAVVFAMLASYVLSRTLVPTMAMYLLQAHGAPRRRTGGVESSGALPARLSSGDSRLRATSYRRLLAGCIRHRAFLPVFLAVCLAAAFCWFPGWGRTSFPVTDAGQFKLHLRAKTGTRIEETARLCDLVEDSIRRVIPAGGTGLDHR